MNKPVTPIDAVKSTDSSKAIQAPDVREASMAQKAGATQPAQHVAPAGHAENIAQVHDVAATAAMEEERGRLAVERIEGSAPTHAIHGTTPHVSVTLRPHVLAHAQGDFWQIMDELRHARANDIEDILQRHPDAAATLARIFLLSGGASALEALRQGQSHNETELPKYVRPAPGEPEI